MTRSNKIINILCSLPILLVFLYFIPFLGVILLIVKSFTSSRKFYIYPTILLILGIALFIPMLVDKIFELIKFDSSKIPYFTQVVSSSLYNDDITKYGRLLIILGVIFMLINAMVKKVRVSMISGFRTFIENDMKKSQEISEKNDLIMKEKREKAKNHNVIICPYCGADNMIYGTSTTCKYCRRSITTNQEGKK